jgi:hypothetical protein
MGGRIRVWPATGGVSENFDISQGMKIGSTSEKPLKLCTDAPGTVTVADIRWAGSNGHPVDRLQDHLECASLLLEPTIVPSHLVYCRAVRCFASELPVLARMA